MTFTILDLVFVVIIILCIVMGLVKGFIDSVFDKAAPLVAVFGAFLFCRRIAEYLSPHIKNSVVAVVGSGDFSNGGNFIFFVAHKFKRQACGKS